MPGLGLVAARRGENHPRPDAPTRGRSAGRGVQGRVQPCGEVENGSVPRSQKRKGEERAYPGGMRRGKLLGANPDHTGRPEFMSDSAENAWASSQAGTPIFPTH